MCVRRDHFLMKKLYSVYINLVNVSGKFDKYILFSNFFNIYNSEIINILINIMNTSLFYYENMHTFSTH